MAARKAPDMESAIALALSDFSDDEVPEFGHGMRKYFQFDDDWTNLNHGMYAPSLVRGRSSSLLKVPSQVLSALVPAPSLASTTASPPSPSVARTHSSAHTTRRSSLHPARPSPNTSTRRPHQSSTSPMPPPA
jgi:hypothetical protein